MYNREVYKLRSLYYIYGFCNIFSPLKMESLTACESTVQLLHVQILYMFSGTHYD